MSKERHKELEASPSAKLITNTTNTQTNGKKYFGYDVDMGSKLVHKRSFTPDDSAEMEKNVSGDEKSTRRTSVS